MALDLRLLATKVFIIIWTYLTIQMTIQDLNTYLAPYNNFECSIEVHSILYAKKKKKNKLKHMSMLTL